ncbi:MotA/TolQ/ExbB proton channel family protein [Mangrovivirga sp. M17]|uniref:MotA/TolQ/ExbB proton channel family protein n=1 Tax=Mangrovivirga halotolerans TaxID=2993936 RepID=A0ABT3RVX7_9BACT|nr:MotA/TolQ/ExbB proton channel family protein [Mangrovivirga halotolerans]MCX2745498.1 MotA/TolQ/ExbB proton channel family protein [Mangrovivirga halotolerans]
MALAFNQSEDQVSFFSIVFERMQDGGIIIMSILLICLIITLILIGRGIYHFKKKSPKLEKSITLINSIGLFALVLGVFGPLLQMIEILDQMEEIGGLKAHQMAGGFKQTILPTLLGCFIFLVSRAFTIMLNWLKPHYKIN